MSFLSLPLEVRSQIYDLALVPSRLCTRAILDPEWLLVQDRGHCIAPLLFVNRQIYYEAALIFYSKATLELSPCQRDPRDGRSLAEFLEQYRGDHTFCPPPFLRAITNVHIYGDQTWPVDQDAYQALFRWLVSSTGVKHIYLSRKTMQQGRHVPEFVSLDNLAYDMSVQTDDHRIIDIYARNISSRLRYQVPGRFNALRPTIPKPDIQLYLDSPLSDVPALYRQPLRSLLMADGSVANAEEDLFREQQERFVNGELGDAYLRQAHCDGYLWLYKTVQIQRKAGALTPSDGQDCNIAPVAIC